MSRILILAVLGLVAKSNGFAYSNYQLPAKTTNRIRWMQSSQKPGIASCRPTSGTTNAASKRSECESLDRVQPIWKHSPTYVQTFQPFRDLVLISYTADDTRGTNAEDKSRQEWDKLTGIVVAAGPLATVKEGARVYMSMNCMMKYSTTPQTNYVTWPYSMEKAKSYNGRLVNGISLNNGNGWAYAGAPYAHQTPNHPHKFETDDAMHYPGRAGDSYWPSGTANTNVLREDAPQDNPHQQPNYLLCRNSDIFGTVKEESFANIDASHYLKPSASYDVSRRGQSWSV